MNESLFIANEFITVISFYNLWNDSGSDKDLCVIKLYADNLWEENHSCDHWVVNTFWKKFEINFIILSM